MSQSASVTYRWVHTPESPSYPLPDVERICINISHEEADKLFTKFESTIVNHVLSDRGVTSSSFTASKSDLTTENIEKLCTMLKRVWEGKRAKEKEHENNRNNGPCFCDGPAHKAYYEAWKDYDTNRYEIGITFKDRL